MNTLRAIGVLCEMALLSALVRRACARYGVAGERELAELLAIDRRPA